MGNIFLKKSYTECGGETNRRPFTEKLKLGILLDKWSKVLYSLFLFVCQVECYQSIYKLSCGPHTFNSY